MHGDILKKFLGAEDLRKFSASFYADPKNVLAMNSVTQNGIASASISRSEMDRMNFTFSDLIDSPEATNQERSGRCWLFSGLSLLALEAMRKLNLKTFELSEIYQMFWDKLEKANYFLENVIETMDEPLDGRVVSLLLADPLSDGGQWNMFVNLVKKYGVLPNTYMPETYNSSNSEAMNTLLTSKLREYAKDLREMNGSPPDELRERKEAFLEEFFRMLCIHLGTPIQEFYWEWRDKDNEFHRRGTMTPLSFFDEYVGMNLEDMVSLINAPTSDKPYNKIYTVRFLGNVVGGKDSHYLNVDILTMKKVIVDMIKNKHAVWFGCDVGKMLQTELGAMDLNIYDYESVLETKFRLDKASRLDYGDSEMTHAMVITGVDLDDQGKPRKWRVENSWGSKIGDKGYMYMMDEWLDEYIYEAVVRKEYLGEDLLSVLDSEPVVLPPWDPMGKLAR
jgi:bleomycin hydrolase